MEKWFLHDNFNSLSHTLVILYTGVDHDFRWASIDFGNQKIKGQGQIGTYDFHCFSTIDNSILL